MKAALACLLTLAATVIASGGEATFAARPAAVKDGDKVRIGFTVSAPTDVEVAVLDSTGKVVCHLAAGMLGGPKPPPEPLKAGLAQTLEWDGKDDFGKPAAGGPFKVRVRLGMKPAFDGFVGASPYALGANRGCIRGMVVDGEGNLYVLVQAYDTHFPGPIDIRVYDRTGKYLRTVMPYPANLKRADAAPFGLIDAPGDGLVPKNGPYGVWPRLYPLGAGPGGWDDLKLSAITKDGVLILNTDRMRQICRIRASDGGCVGPSFAGNVFPKGDKRLISQYVLAGSSVVALAPDGKTLYMTGSAGVPPKGQKSHPEMPDGRVYKTSLDKLGAGPEVFVDVPLPEKCPPPEAGWVWAAHKVALRGIATDSRGHVYVSDTASGRVRKYSPEGKELCSAPAPGALQAVLDEKTGALYVLDGKGLAKLSGCDENAKVVARLECGGNFLALDAGGERPQVWVGNTGKGSIGLLRVADEGTQLKLLEDLNDRDKSALRSVDRIAVDPETDDVYVSNGWAEVRRFAGLTGAPGAAMSATDVTVSPDGYVYIQQGPNFAGAYQRLTRELKPAPLAATGKDVFGFVYGRYGAGFCTKGSCVGWDGKVYSLGMLGWCEYFVAGYDRDGKALPGKRPAPSGLVEAVRSGKPYGYGLEKSGLTSSLIGKLSVDNGGLKVDRAGNIYVGLQIWPADHKPPAGFEKDEVYKWLAGSVVKFGPEGGGPPAGKGALADYEGVKQVYPGLGSFSGSRGCCACRSPRFDLDPYGRLYLPNTITFDTRIVDNAGNEIAKFGAYGNFDSQWVPEGSTDKKPIVATPDVPLGWPLAAGASEKKIYVGDLYNRRVIRVDKKFAAEETCEVK